MLQKLPVQRKQQLAGYRLLRGTLDGAPGSWVRLTESPRGVEGAIWDGRELYAVTSRDQDGVRYAPGHDRRHNLNLVASWKAGPYQVGTRLGLASGTPYTQMVGQFVRRTFNPATNSWEPPGAPPQDVDYLGGVRNGARYPITQRLDLNVSRDYQRGRATIRPFVSVVNAYNARNVFLYILDYGEAPPVRRTISQFPILPSVGVSIVF